ncbi:hypothetical protein BCL90_2982 [Pedobacter alluvionis]|uniref:Uncharacterized protein n=1 Tax=Pedobacter alluvionis TaxID=475253 RepID=A0A497XZ80_9SPHI|nr:hypothetical protein BCL90_2982 [Pedobacter alluvionis]
MLVGVDTRNKKRAVMLRYEASLTYYVYSLCLLNPFLMVINVLFPSPGDSSLRSE